MKKDIADKKLLKEEEAAEALESARGKKGKKPKEDEEEEIIEEVEDKEPWVIKYSKKNCKRKSRWIIPAKRTIRIFIKYYSKTKTTQSTKITFESFFSLKTASVSIQGITSLP